VQIIDAHQHLWDTSALRYPWLEGFDALRQRYTAEDYRATTAGASVIRSVHVEADPGEGEEATEVEWLSRIAQQDGMIGAIVAAAPLESKSRRQTLDRLKSFPLVVGVRRMAWHRGDPDFYQSPELIEGVRTLADYGFSFDLCANVTQLHAALVLVRETPEISHIIDHCGGPDIAGGGFRPWAEQMSRLADFPNTVCKISGIVTRASAQWTKEDLKPFIDHLIGVFGYDRVAFGSDWPVCTLAAQYGQWLDTLKWAVWDASETEKQKLFHDNAKRFYRIQD